MKKRIKKALRWLLLKPLVICLIMVKYKADYKTAIWLYRNIFLKFNQI